MLTARSTTKPNQEPYLSAKKKAMELIADIDLYLRQPVEQYKQIVAEIVQSVVKCQGRHQRGEIYLLLCQSAVKMGIKIGGIPLPNLFQEDVFTYLSTLIEDQPAEPKQTSQIYKLKQVPATGRTTFRDGKDKLKDLLLIQRYDVVLAALVRELEEEGLAGNSKQRVITSKQFQNFIEGTIRIAQRYLEKKEYEEYRDNVNRIAKGKTEKIKKVTKRISRSLMSLSQHYMLIDSTAHLSGFFVRGGKSQKQATMISGGRESNRSSSSKRSSSKRSFLKDQFMDLRGIGEGLNLKRNSMMTKSIKRGSGVSNCTLRSSIVMNHNFMGKNPSNFGLASRLPPRSSSRLALRSSELKVRENRPERKSRFQILSKFQEQGLRQEFGQLQGQADPEAISSTTLLPQKTSRVFCYLQEGERLSWHELHPFFIFLQLKSCIFLVRVQEQQLQGSELLQSGQIKAVVRVKLMQDELQFYLTLDLDIQWNEDEDIEVICQEYLVKHLNITKKEKEVKVSIESEEISSQRGNLIRLGRAQEGVLMGFIRKISTYFIHKSKYLCSSLHQSFEYGLRKRLLTESKALPFPIPLQSRLMNSDLTMSFQQEQTQMVRSGSVIAYIQNEQLSLGLNFNSDQSFKLIFEHCALREWEDITMWRIWAHPKYKQELFQPKRKKGRKFNSRIHKAITADEQNSSRKLKKMAHNKSSIRLQSPELEALYQQYDLRVTNNSKTASKRDMISEKRISKNIVALVQEKTKKQRNQDKRTTVFIESIRTDRGYKLSKKSVVEHISGFVYNQYQGHSERNPQMTRFYKGQPSECVHGNFLQSSMSIRGNESQVSNIKLLTFVKPLRNMDDHFLGYLISDIKILILSANRCIFIETYWQKMQKHFIFTLSNEFFEQLTDINTTHFWEKPLVKAEDKVSKKREKRTSVMNYFQREKKERSVEMLHGSTSRRNRVGRDNSLGNQEEPGKVSQFARFKETKARFGQTLKIETSCQSLYSFASMKTGQRLQFKRDLSSKIKSKLIRSANFLWKDHTLRLLIRHSPATATHYSPASFQFQFVGRELAVKNTHQSPCQPQLAAAVELILIRYKENNLTNLSIFTQQGINQISLEHIFIKNNDDLYGRYENVLNLSSLPNEITAKQYYKQNNHFFDRNGQREDSRSKQGRNKNAAIKFTGREEQKRFKYVQILGFAKECSLPFGFVQEKRKKHVKRTFVIPNRYKILEEEEETLHIHLYSDVVKVTTLQGTEIITFSIKKMEHYFPFIRKLNQQQFKKIFLRRVLQDQDVMRLCQQTEEETF